jgi:hypothetical protein
MVNEMLELANNAGLQRGKTCYTGDIASDSPSTKNVREKVMECMVNDMPLVIRRLGKRIGGIGKTSTTETLLPLKIICPYHSYKLAIQE